MSHGQAVVSGSSAHRVSACCSWSCWYAVVLGKGQLASRQQVLGSHFIPGKAKDFRNV